jgi:hypothetical protein
VLFNNEKKICSLKCTSLEQLPQPYARLKDLPRKIYSGFFAQSISDKKVSYHCHQSLILQMFYNSSLALQIIKVLVFQLFLKIEGKAWILP